MRIGQEFVDIGWSIKGGLPYQPWAAALVKERTAKNGMDDPGSHCFPIGLIKRWFVVGPQWQSDDLPQR
jgi:hypothetical protein